jgi:hypothetical protein
MFLALPDQGSGLSNCLGSNQGGMSGDIYLLKGLKDKAFKKAYLKLGTRLPYRSRGGTNLLHIWTYV